MKAGPDLDRVEGRQQHWAEAAEQTRARGERPVSCRGQTGVGGLQHPLPLSSGSDRAVSTYGKWLCVWSQLRGSARQQGG